MSARAELAAGERLDNVSFELADAQTHPFDHGRFDVVVSRFGTMFFADPAAAFANLAAALRPGARLVLLIWQSRGVNHRMQAIDAALGDAAGSPEPGRSRTTARCRRRRRWFAAIAPARSA